MNRPKLTLHSIAEALLKEALTHPKITGDVPMNDQQIEAEIQAKGLNAPRLSPEKIDAVILSESYHVFPGTALTVCCLTLRNGFAVTGESSAVSLANFDAELGRKIARQHARDKIWALEGYLLKERLWDSNLV
jgi:hypothetical protein